MMERNKHIVSAKANDQYLFATEVNIFRSNWDREEIVSKDVEHLKNVRRNEQSYGSQHKHIQSMNAW